MCPLSLVLFTHTSYEQEVDLEIKRLFSFFQTSSYIYLYLNTFFFAIALKIPVLDIGPNNIAAKIGKTINSKLYRYKSCVECHIREITVFCEY